MIQVVGDSLFQEMVHDMEATDFQQFDQTPIALRDEPLEPSRATGYCLPRDMYERRGKTLQYCADLPLQKILSLDTLNLRGRLL